MSSIKFEEVPLYKIFINENGNSKYTKTFCNENKGPYPVYTSTTKGDFGSINTYDYSTKNLSLATHGNVGKLDILEGNYNVGNNRMLLLSLVENIDFKYIKYVLEPLISKKAKTSSVSFVSWNVIKDIKIPIPLEENGNFNIEEQNRIANIYSVLENKRIYMEEKIKKLQESYVTFSSSDYKFVEKPLSEIFEFKRGRSCTRNYCNQNKGKYPVYSANNIIPLAYINTYDYDGRFITLSRNGIAGKITVFDEKFTINEDRFILIPKIHNIDYDYIKYTVEPILRSRKKGRAGYNGQNEFTKLSFTILNNVKILLPLNEKNKISLEIQEEVANKYKKLENIKKSILEKAISLTKIELSLK